MANVDLNKEIFGAPVWVWGGGVGIVGIALLLRFKTPNSTSIPQNTGILPTTQTASGSVPASLIPQFVNQVYNQETPPIVTVNDNTPVTINNPSPGPAPQIPSPAPMPIPQPPSPPPPAPIPAPIQAPAPQPVQQPAGQWVTVTPWSRGSSSWSSTLWGIAQHFYGNGSQYGRIFSANRSGVMRPDGSAGSISNPSLIYPGERLWVPA